MPWKNSFQYPTLVNRMMVASMGTEQGTTMLNRMRHGPAPSTRAASSRFCGRLRKKFITSKRLNTGRPPHNTRPQMVSMAL